MSSPTQLTELAPFFGYTKRTQKIKRIVAVAPRFWQDGDTYEQAVARQQESANRIKAKLAANLAKEPQ